VEMRGGDIDGEAQRIVALEEGLRGQWISLQKRKAVLDGQRVVIGALLQALEAGRG